MPTVPDSEFPTPTTLNAFPCITADRYLNAVPELLEITAVCQDSNNPSLVIIDFNLVGSYEFTPVCRVVVDYLYSKTSPRSGKNIVQKIYAEAPLAVGHPLNPLIPINTGCGVFHGRIVYDFSAVLPNYTSQSSIEFELVMNGSIPLTFNVTFNPQSPSDSYVWNKGKLPTPISLSYDRGLLTTQFYYDGTQNCSCRIQCIVPSGVSNNLVFCPDEKQTIVIEQGDLTQDPYTFLLRLEDTLGNVSNVEVQSLIGAEPIKPVTIKKTNPRCVEVSINAVSVLGKEIKNSSYQVIKYVGTRGSYKIWKDWSSYGWSRFIDTDVAPNTKYGYAVRFKGDLGDVSSYSEWAEIEF